MSFRVVCAKEKEFLEDGCTIEGIYSDFEHENLSKEDADEVALQLNEFPVDDETYSVEEE